MKRVLTFLAIMLLPLSVWAMTPVTDSDLSNVTGQAGVNINADLTMDINIGTMAWGDADGVQGVYDPWTTVNNGAGGYIGMTSFNIHGLVIRARTDDADNYNTYSTLMLKPITIDVATGDKSDQGGSSTATFVRFGLGALKISMNAMQFKVALGDRPTAGADLNLDQVMGVVSFGDFAMYINPTSYVDIFAHSAMGVSFDVNVTLDRLSFDYMSWGDRDGLGATYHHAAGETDLDWMNTVTTGGYVGLSNFNLGDAMHPAVEMNGTVAIDVATASGGIYLNESMGAGAGATAVSVVHISFPGDIDNDLDGGAACGFRINVAKITADVALSNQADINAVGTGISRGVLGDIYIQGMEMKIGQGSWVDIWAH